MSEAKEQTMPRELDMQIAERLGLWKPETECEYDIAYAGSSHPVCYYCRNFDLPWDNLKHDVPCPEFSTDIAAAWKVVEAMRERGWSDIDINIVPYGTTCHMATGQLPGNSMIRSHSATGRPCQSPCEAICHAAILALDVSEGPPIESDTMIT